MFTRSATLTGNMFRFAVFVTLLLHGIIFKLKESKSIDSGPMSRDKLFLLVVSCFCVSNSAILFFQLSSTHNPVDRKRIFPDIYRKPLR